MCGLTYFHSLTVGYCVVVLYRRMICLTGTGANIYRIEEKIEPIAKPPLYFTLTCQMLKEFYI